MALLLFSLFLVQLCGISEPREHVIDQDLGYYICLLPWEFESLSPLGYLEEILPTWAHVLYSLVLYLQHIL